ncbi:hypothetical protein DEU56DRAFT_981191 [Suillus clintonianus]|uniref:uncharacterized protein n=1 Tax=Suillus clintonianus TaxID=1904413 RepID=UPI001B8604AB|nr:uncharacterized protein DEU56DRAFT_981191 [Suillus clintonianus]KAG2135105.1 hypothetical protein DEU56DRAFT_981191 [Suillus clintonianus]
MSRSDLDCGFAVAAFVGVAYGWALTFGQEVELVWRQRWSLMTVLYLSVRYLGIFYTPEHTVLCSDNFVDRCSESSAPMPAIPIQLTATPCRDVSRILTLVWDWTTVVAFPMLCVIMIARLHAMYQRSARILIFLVVVCFAINIFDGVATAMTTRDISSEELILSGTYACTVSYANYPVLLASMTWILGTVWEVLALCLAVWIAVKHFRELRQHSDLFSLEIQIYAGLLQILQVIQAFVLGPRLILSVREYNARSVADSDAATGMSSIAFQERVHISTGSGV